MYPCTCGTIYCWWPEIDLYQLSLHSVFAAILVLFTIAVCPLVRQHESLFSSLLESLVESLFESLLESVLERASHWEELSFQWEDIG
jgi:hypothetical protein